MVNLLRIWLPYSLAVHGILFALLVLVPPAKTSLITEKKTPMKVSLVAITPTSMQQPPKAKDITRPRVVPVKKPTESPQKSVNIARDVKTVEVTKIAPSIPVKPNTTTSTSNDRPTANGILGKPSSSYGKSSALTNPTTNSRPEGWGDSPAAGNGINPIGIAGPGRGRGGSTSPYSGISGTAVSLRPGSSPSSTGIGGSAGSYGGIGRPVLGMPSSTGGILAGMGATIITSAGTSGDGWHNQPGAPGGAGIGSGGMMSTGPTRPGMPGSTIAGSAGTAIGLRPGGISSRGDMPINYGGAPGIPGMPLIGAGAPGGIPTAIAGGGSPNPTSGVADQPINSGIRSGTGNDGPQTGKPSYAAAAVSGPAPSYPRVARTENVTGTVVLEVFIDAAGNVVRVVILQRSPSDILDNEAKRKLSQWQYRPAMKEGKMTAGSVKRSVSFTADAEPVVKEIK